MEKTNDLKTFILLLTVVGMMFMTAANAVSEETWLGKTVASYGDVGQYSSLAIDKSGTLHIVYFDGQNGDLKHATSSIDSASRSWATETIDSYEVVGNYASMAMDAQGYLHVSYYAVEEEGSYPEKGSLKYATNASGSWVTATVDSDGDMVGRYTSIATDKTGKVHITYNVTTLDEKMRPEESLKYATDASGSWLIKTVEKAESLVLEDDTYISSPYPFISAVKMNSTGNVNIAYYSYNYDINLKGYIGNLKYATSASGSWVITVADKEEVGQYSSYMGTISMAIDAGDKVHISYYRPDFNTTYYRPEGDLKYATNVSGVWTSETVDEHDDAGMYSAIATDSSGNVHIAYYASEWNASYYRSEGALHYATNASGEWISEVVDNQENAGLYPSLVIDDVGYIHISYYEQTDGNLKYITNRISLKSGYMASPDLWIRAVIKTGEEAGDIEAVWKRGGKETTASGAMVIWGYFYASPDDVTWGSANNPDLFVKIWVDPSGRLDVNFFHVSVPDIEVYSDYKYDGTIDEQNTATTSDRYVKHYYENGESFVEINKEDGISPPEYEQKGNPTAYNTINGLKIGAIINIEDWPRQPLDATWYLGGIENTERGDTVVWGYFYADPHAVSWGSVNNPDLYVKIWFDVSGRIDVNYFHVSVPTIEVYSDYPSDGSYDKTGITLMTDRYTRHEFQKK